MPCCKWQASSFCWECTLPHVCPPHAGWCFLQFWFLLLTLLPLLSQPPPIFTSCHHPISHTQSPPHPPSLLYLPGSVSLAVLVPSVHGMPASLTTPLPSFFLILCNTPAVLTGLQRPQWMPTSGKMQILHTRWCLHRP